MKMGNLIYIVVAMVVLALPLEASNSRVEFDAQVGTTIAKLNREAVSIEGAMRLAELIQGEFGTPVNELQWAMENGYSWGEITAFAYIRATNGRTLSELGSELGSAQARADLWTYTEKAGMNSAKMAHALEAFLKQAEKDRNSRIFQRMRTTRQASPMPDLGNGFGLFQEALDFRQVNTPGPTKIHTVGPTAVAKGDQ
jgi:hypothetical protein